MLDDFDIVAALTKAKRSEDASASSTKTTTIFGVATGDSLDGYVMVDFGGKSVTQDDSQSVKIPTIANVRKGDAVKVSLIGSDGTAKSPVVDGVIGGGDRTAKTVTEAKKAADAAVTSVREQYCLSTSQDEPTGGEWSDNPPTWATGKWIWSRSVITYGGGDQTTTPAICVTGNTGGGVESVDVMYYLSSSSTDLSDGSWVTTYPGYKDGYWLWTKTVTTYTDGTQTVSGAACITGSTGQSAITVEMLSDNGTTFKNGRASSDITITVWRGTLEMGDLAALRAEFGTTARLLWWEKSDSGGDFASIADTDTRLSDDGFRLAVDAAKVANRAIYRCSVDF